MDLDEAAEQLYAGSPDDFVERRTALVAQARAAKDRLLAKQVGALRRPTRTAWVLNLLARQAPGEVADLLALGDSLRDAQARLDGGRLRELSAARRRAVDRLARRAVDLGREHGWAAPEGTTAEAGATLQAALADPAVADTLRQGRLTSAASYGGFGPADLASALAASLPARPRGEPSATLPRPGPEQPAPEPEPDPREEQRARAEAALVAARETLAVAEREAEAATARADALADRIEELRAELDRAGADERAASDAARAARRRLSDARRALAEAEHTRRSLG